MNIVIRPRSIGVSLISAASLCCLFGGCGPDPWYLGADEESEDSPDLAAPVGQNLPDHSVEDSETYPDLHGDSPAAATVLHSDGTTMTGVVNDSHDKDFFTFTVQRAREYRLEYEMLSSQGVYRPTVTVYDSDGNIIETTDQALFNDEGFRASYVPLAAQEDTTLFAAVLPDNFAPRANERFEYKIWLRQGDAHTGSIFTALRKNVLAAGSSAFGEIYEAGDVDAFAVNMESDRVYTIETSGPTETAIALWSIIPCSDESCNYRATLLREDFGRIHFENPTAGFYGIEVSHRFPDGTGTYELTISEQVGDPLAEMPPIVAAPVEPERVVTDDETGLPVAADQLVVIFDEVTTPTQVVEIVESLGGTVIGRISALKMYQVQLPNGVDHDALKAEFENVQAVIAVFPNVIGQLNSDPECAEPLLMNRPEDRPDTYLSDQWYLDTIQAPCGWQLERGSQSIRIAVVDTGIDPDLDDLEGRIGTGWNIATGTSDTRPDTPFEEQIDPDGATNYHGTEVAQVIAARPNNAADIAGVMWDGRIVPIKVARGGWFGIFDLAAGIQHGIAHGTKVINVSVGVKAPVAWFQSLYRQIEIARDKEVLIVAGAANREDNFSWFGGIYPAYFAETYQNVIAVAATDNNDRFAFGYHTPITVAAPGWFMRVIGPSGTATRVYGTSYATPLVSSLAGLIWSLDWENGHNFEFGASVVREIITDEESTYIPDPPDPRLGAGIINVYRALMLARERLGLPPEEPPSNQPPITEDQNVIVPFETPTTITLTATDPDNGPSALTYSVVSNPAHGALSALTGSQVAYTPNPGYSGLDSFTFTVNDGEVDSNVATVSITIDPALAGGSTTRISVASSGAEANGASFAPSISTDGRYVAFHSFGTNIAPGDTTSWIDVFVHDSQTGQNTLVSVSSAGSQGNGDSLFASISAHGRYVAFTSGASNLVPGDTNGSWDVFVRDRQTGQTSRVSIDFTGSQGNGDSGHLGSLSMSANGRYVAFESRADNLVPNDGNFAAADVFIHDRQTGETTLVSVDSSGQQGNVDSNLPSVSGDGRFVAFESRASNLVPDDTNSVTDVFVRNWQNSQTVRVSVDSDGVQGNGSSELPAISADGRYVAFWSAASNLVPGDTNGQADFFVHDLQTGQTTRVNVDSAGNESEGTNGGFRGLSISSDGRFVAFASPASNLVPSDTNGAWDIFVHDRQTGKTSRVSVSSSGSQSNGDSGGIGALLSADGGAVVFHSSANNLVPNDANGVDDVFVHDRGP